jgi:hypothetical protein
MLEILVRLSAVRKNDSDIIPFIDHHDHRDGTMPFANTDDGFDRNWEF